MPAGGPFPGAPLGRAGASHPEVGRGAHPAQPPAYGEYQAPQEAPRYREYREPPGSSGYGQRPEYPQYREARDRAPQPEPYPAYQESYQRSYQRSPAPEPSAHPYGPAASAYDRLARECPPPEPSAAPPAPPPAPPRRRSGLVLVLATVLVLALAVAGVVVVRPGPVAGWLAGVAQPTATPEVTEPPPPPVLAAAASDAPIPTAAGVGTAIDSLLATSGLGPRINIAVRDIATGEVLYDHGADLATVPASTTKLATAVTVLAVRGPAYRIPTRAVAGASPGEVVIVGGGDPTLAAGAKGSYPGAGRLDQLAAQVKKSLGTTPTKVTVDSSLYQGPIYGPGWDPDVPTACGGAITALMVDGARVDPVTAQCTTRYREPDLAAGKDFAKALGLPGAAVKAVAKGTAPAPNGASGAASPAGGAAVSPGTELGRVESPPLVRLVEFMLEHSDNIIAEALARQVALARRQPASFAGAAAAMDAVLAELGLDAGQSALSDGSGLSRNNRITPALQTALLALAANGSRPELSGLFAGLPVAAWSGTLADRYDGSATGADGAGVVRAKTGTLTGVTAIAGVLMTADGRGISFSLLADRVSNGWVAKVTLDRIAAKLATCGCR